MNKNQFYHEPLSLPIGSDAVERLYLFEERAAIHQFDGRCTYAMAQALASGNQANIEFLKECGHGERVESGVGS